MGLFGGSSKSTSSTTNNIDSSTVQSNQAGAGLALTGDDNRVTVTDGGIVEKALTFASESGARAFEFGGKSVDGAFNLSKGIADKTLAANAELLKQSINAAQNNSERAYQFATQAASPGSANPDNIKTIATAAVILISVFIFTKLKRA